MKKPIWLFALALVCIAAFACSQDGGNGFTDNPVAPTQELSNVTNEAQLAPVLICHFDVDLEDPYDSIAIYVNGNSVDRHIANHGDCLYFGAPGTENCGCS